jgi:hypothetical protein
MPKPWPESGMSGIRISCNGNDIDAAALRLVVDTGIHSVSCDQPSIALLNKAA